MSIFPTMPDTDDMGLTATTKALGGLLSSIVDYFSDDGDSHPQSQAQPPQSGQVEDGQGEGKDARDAADAAQRLREQNQNVRDGVLSELEAKEDDLTRAGKNQAASTFADFVEKIKRLPMDDPNYPVAVTKLGIQANEAAQKTLTDAQAGAQELQQQYEQTGNESEEEAPSDDDEDTGTEGDEDTGGGSGPSTDKDGSTSPDLGSLASDLGNLASAPANAAEQAGQGLGTLPQAAMGMMQPPMGMGMGMGMPGDPTQTQAADEARLADPLGVGGQTGHGDEDQDDDTVDEDDLLDPLGVDKDGKGTEGDEDTGGGSGPSTDKDGKGTEDHGTNAAAEAGAGGDDQVTQPDGSKEAAPNKEAAKAVNTALAAKLDDVDQAVRRSYPHLTDDPKTWGPSVDPNDIAPGDLIVKGGKFGMVTSRQGKALAPHGGTQELSAAAEGGDGVSYHRPTGGNSSTDQS